MSDYEKSVLEALKNGPKPRNELVKELYPKIMSQKKLQKTLNELEDGRRIINRPSRIGESHKWTSIYALPKHRHLLEVEYSQVARVVKYLRLELCRNPDVEEVAAKIGEDLENVRKILFEHAPELKWVPPTPKEKEKTNELQKKARELAALVKYSKEADYGLENKISESEISRQVLESAQFILEHQFEAIKEKDIPFIPAVIGPGFPLPSKPLQRKKEEAMKIMRRFKSLKAGMKA